MKKRILCGALAALLGLSLLTGCEKKNGEIIVSTPTETPVIPEPTTAQVTSTETFTSSDGKMELTLAIDQYVSSGTLPVVEVVPRDLTVEDINSVARAVFGDTVFYERPQQSNPKYTKEMLQDQLDLLYELDEEGLKDLYGYCDMDTLSLVGRYIQLYTQKLEDASAEEYREPFGWKFRKEDYHTDHDNGNKVLCGTAKVGDIPYSIYSIIREKGDYQYNRIYIDLGYGLGLHYEKAQLRARLCRTAEPTQEQIDLAADKAQAYLDNMDLGQWQVCSTEVRTDESAATPEYTIVVQAVPVVAGVPVLDGQHIYNLQDAQYFNSNAYFLFSANGDVVYMDLTAPIEEVSIVEAAPEVLTVQELLDAAKPILGELDTSAGIGTPSTDFMFLMYDESINSKVAITSLKYGLSRQKVPGKNLHFYYVPTLVFCGVCDYYGDTTGILRQSSGDGADLLWLDARDGSVIPTD